MLSSDDFFNEIKDNQLVTELLLFCDFYSAVSLGRTCRRLKSCSDAALDRMADMAASRMDYCSDNNIIAFSDYSNNTILQGEYRELRRGWSNTFCCKVALIEEALTNCVMNI